MHHLHRLLSASLLALVPVAASAQRPWVEARGPNVSVMTDAGEGRAREIAWQFEQVREALSLSFPWVRSNLSRPLLVLAARDATTMRQLVPAVFERTDGKSYATVSASGPDRAFVALRADLRIEDREGINPYQSAYWAFAAQALGETHPGFPVWLWRGLASVMSNTLVRDREMQVGRTLPNHLMTLRGHGRMALRDLVTLGSDDPRLKRPEFLDDLDANAWAFVHFLLYADEGAHRRLVEALVRSMLNGSDPTPAMDATLGEVSRFETPFNVYINRDLFAYTKVGVSAKLSREGFTARVVSPAEAAVVRGALHAAMNRPVEARAAAAEAKRLDPASAADEVTGLLADRENRENDVRTALEAAVTQKYASWYASYRLATMLPTADPASLARVETLLRQATTLNPYADQAWAFLGQVMASLDRGVASVEAAERAIGLMPASSSHRVAYARTLWRLRRRDDALKAAGIARALARTQPERAAAQGVLAELARDVQRSAPPPAEETAPAPATAASRPPDAAGMAPATIATASPPEPKPSSPSATATETVGSLINTCFADNTSCRRSLPLIAGDCNDPASVTGAAACRNVGYILDVGLGMPAQPGAAADYYRKGCDRKDEVSCVRLATLRALGRGVPKDVAAALQTLNAACANGVQEGCFRLGVQLSSTKVPADLSRAREVLTASCQARFAESCAWLAKLPPG